MSLKSVTITRIGYCYEMARPILQLEATEEEVLELGRLVRGTKVSVGDRFRAQNYSASAGR